MFDFKSLEDLREDNRLEAKEAAGGVPKSVWSTYSAFANTNGGVILLGVSEDSQHQLTAVGLRDPERVIKDFWDTINNPSKVSANILIEDDVAIERVGSASIVVVHVPRADREIKPVYINQNPIGGTYRRNGEGDYKCSEEEYRAMVRDNGTGSITLDHMPLEGFTPDDLDHDTVNAYRNTLSAARPGHPWLALDPSEFLIRLGAVARGKDRRFHPTRAGLLMFGNEWNITQEFPYYFLDYRETSDGARRWDHRIVSGDGEWSGNLFGFWLKVWPQLMQAVRRPFGLDAGMQRIDDTPLHMALREALANTIIHADYYMRGNTVIVKSNDTITFRNPGGMRMSPEVAMAGGLSDSRNPTLLKMFALISVVERAGSGFDAMRAGCDWARIPYPELVESFDPDATQLTFHISPIHPNGSVQRQAAVAARRLEHHDDGFETERRQILDFLQQSPSITRAEVEQLTGLKTTMAKRILKGLMEDGLIERQGQGRGVRYVLKQ